MGVIEMWKPAQPEDAHGWWVIQGEDGCEIGSCDGGFEEEQARMMAASHDLYTSTQWLLDAVEKLISNKPIKDLDERIGFAKSIMKNAKLDA
jgi:hypothetical protein